MKVLVGILAHSDSPELQRQIEALRSHARLQPRFVVFNGGRDHDLVRHIGEQEHPESEPLKYGNLAMFHLRVLESASKFDVDFLITMDSDVWPGLQSWDHRIVQYASEHNADYLGNDFAAVKREPYEPGTCARMLWHRGWKEITGSVAPYRAGNCVQVFGRNYFHAVEGASAILEEVIPQSNVFGLEEILWPSFAVGHGMVVYKFPVPQPLRVSRKRWQADELAEALPTSFGLVHPCSSAEMAMFRDGDDLTTRENYIRFSGMWRKRDWKTAVSVRWERQMRVARCRFVSRW